MLEKESITDLLMATLLSARSTRRFKSILCERKLKRYKKESVRVALYRLKEKGYIENLPGGWSMTEKGKKKLQEENLLSYIPSPFNKNHPHDIIISFDIPTHSNVLRDWLRNQIKIFGYKLLQQSLWIGPGPLPKEFLTRLEKLKIRKNVKTFRVRKKSN